MKHSSNVQKRRPIYNIYIPLLSYLKYSLTTLPIVHAATFICSSLAVENASRKNPSPFDATITSSEGETSPYVLAENYIDEYQQE